MDILPFGSFHVSSFADAEVHALERGLSMQAIAHLHVVCRAWAAR
jgi:hypothetical protein